MRRWKAIYLIIGNVRFSLVVGHYLNTINNNLAAYEIKSGLVRWQLVVLTVNVLTGFCCYHNNDFFSNSLTAPETSASSLTARLLPGGPVLICFPRRP